MPAVLVTGARCHAELTVSSIAVAVTIANTHFAYSRRDGQAELTVDGEYRYVFGTKYVVQGHESLYVLVFWILWIIGDCTNHKKI